MFPHSVPVRHYEVIKPWRKNRHSVPTTIKLQESCDSAPAPPLLLPASASQVEAGHSEVDPQHILAGNWLLAGCACHGQGALLLSQAGST